MTLVELIKQYYEARSLVWPNFDDAMKFVQTEIGEVYELDLARGKSYVRNNPQNKPKFSAEELGIELGDAIMMLIVAGLVEGVDPVQSLISKIERKLASLSTPKVDVNPPNNIPENTAYVTSIQTPVYFVEDSQ